MTTFTKNTKKHSAKVFSFAFAVMAALFGAGCEGPEGVEGGEEGGEEAVEMGQTQQAISGKIGLNPTQMKQKCEAGGRVYDPSTNGCSATCAPGFVPSGKDSFKCISVQAKCEQSATTFAQFGACAACAAGYQDKCPVYTSEKACLAAGNYWSQEGKTCHITGSIGHHDALCKHNGMEYDPSKKGQNFPCKVSTNPSSPGGIASPPAPSCVGSFDCMAVFCNYPGNETWQACKNIETIPGWITGG